MKKGIVSTSEIVTLLGETEVGSIAAIFADLGERNHEPFYLVAVKGKNIATETVRDVEGHKIPSDRSYIVGSYFEKLDENLKKGYVQYKSLAVRPGQVFYLCVKLDAKLCMDFQEYNFLSDCA